MGARAGAGRGEAGRKLALLSRGEPVVAWTRWWQWGSREVDLGFILEVELTSLGNGSMWVVRVGGSKDASQFSGLSNWVDDGAIS